MSTSEIIEALISAIEKAERRGFSRYQLSRRAEVPQSTISRLMRRERPSLKVETVEALCRELGFVLEMKPRPKKGAKS